MVKRTFTKRSNWKLANKKDKKNRLSKKRYQNGTYRKSKRPKNGKKKFVVQAVARRQWPKWGLAHRVILCPTCWPIAIQSKMKNGKNKWKKTNWKITHSFNAQRYQNILDYLKIFHMMALGLLQCTSYKYLTTKICMAAYDHWRGCKLKSADPTL